MRSAPSVLIVPWESAFGWDRSTVSVAAAVGIFLYGLMGPFAAALMQSFGVRRTLAIALSLLSLSACLSLFMTEPWQLVATWGVLVGPRQRLRRLRARGDHRQPLVHDEPRPRHGHPVGEHRHRQPRIPAGPRRKSPSPAGSRWSIAVALATAALIPLVLLLVPERPADIGTEPYGALPGAPPAPEATRANPLRTALATLAGAARVRDFWLLLATFFICGFTTHGLIGTHLIPMCSDYGIAAVDAAGLHGHDGGVRSRRHHRLGLAHRPLRQRACCCSSTTACAGSRCSTCPIPISRFYGLSLFAVFYGLDWIATVPPTLRLTNAAFGDRAAPIVFGWIAAGHQLGAASAAFLGGVLRSSQGTYLEAFFIAGAAALLAAGLSLLIARPLAEEQVGPANPGEADKPSCISCTCT